MSGYSPSTYLEGVAWITQGWPKYNGGKKHSGIDLACRKTDEIVVVESGKISEIVKGTPDKVGRIVVVGDSSENPVIYKHVQCYCDLGESVSEGDIIGCPDESGKASGLWDGYHLHFQIGNGEFDPILYLMKIQPELLFAFSKTYNMRQYYMKKEYWHLLEEREHKVS